MQLIGFTGYAGCGKTEAVACLQVYHRFEIANLGRIIKERLDPFTTERLGISALTQDRREKRRIRALLEHYGEADYVSVLAEYEEALDDLLGHTFRGVCSERVCSLPEAYAWKKRGGVIYEITRPGVNAVSAWEEGVVESLRAVPWAIDGVIENDGTKAELWKKVDALVETRDAPTEPPPVVYGGRWA